jgi:hypothetical protein
MLDPDALGEKLVEWGIERRYVFPFQSLYITSLFKDHDQGNMPICLIPVSKIFEIDGKISPKSQNSFMSRIIWLNVTNLLDFGEVDLIAFDENCVCVRDLRSLLWPLYEIHLLCEYVRFRFTLKHGQRKCNSEFQPEIQLVID